MNDRNVPSGFTPYETLIFCSNTIEGGGHLFQIGNEFPLLIGKGNPPSVWLLGVSDSRSGELKTIISKSKSRSSNFSVIDAFGGTIVMAKGQKVLSVRELSDKSAEVDFVDLRPAGLNVFGDKLGLKIGGMSLSGNSISGGGVFVSLG